MYWTCRRLWPGDEDFTPENFGGLGVSYVRDAIVKGYGLRRKELHEQELAVANLTALTANINRDGKKVKTPYKVVDFCFFAGDEERNNPDGENAAAYMELNRRELLPRWALFIFPQMKGLDVGINVPEPLAAIGDGALLLAPQIRNGGIEGLLLATQAVSGKDIYITMNGETRTASIPQFDEWVLAREDVFLPIR